MTLYLRCLLKEATTMLGSEKAIIGAVGLILLGIIASVLIG